MQGTALLTMASRVLHVLGTSSAEGTAFARILTGLARHLDCGYALRVLFLGGDGTWSERFARQGIPCATFDPRGSLLAPARLLNWARAVRPAIVHQHAGGARLSRALKWTTGARIVRHVHGTIDEATLKESGMISAPEADAVVACSRHVAHHVAHRNCTVIYAGVDSDSDPPQARARGPIVIGTAGRLVELKGHAHLIRALAALLPEFPHARLEICGDGAARADLERLAARVGCKDAVRFHGWRDDFPRICAGWDVFALPSLAEGFGIALLEAMAAGLPSVASDVGGVRELLEPETSGLLATPGDAIALAGSMRRLLSSASLRSRLGSAAREVARRRFPARRMAAEMQSLYSSL